MSNEEAFKSIYESLCPRAEVSNNLLYGTIVKSNPLSVRITDSVVLESSMLIPSSVLIRDEPFQSGEKVILFAFNDNSVFYIADRL
jgi:hypothetical protein